jgi:hypothetical protein
MIWCNQIAQFIKSQYQRTSIPILIVSSCTLGVAATGLIYTISGYHSQQTAIAKNQRNEALKNILRQYYKEATDLLTETSNLPKDISTDDLSAHLTKSTEWMRTVYQWTRDNLGDGAAATLRKRQQTVNFIAAHGSAELNNLLNTLSSFQDNIENLINSDVWYSTQK